MDKIERIIEAIRHERYRFAPARRVYIPKKSGAMRPLGMPTWSDKLVGEVVRLLLEAYYLTDLLRPLARVPSWSGLPHRVAGSGEHLAGDHLVHRGRHLQLLFRAG